MSEPRRKAKPGVNRTEVFGFRMDPRMKYLSELAARKQRRSLANFIEWAVETALENTVIGEGESLLMQAKKLWDVDPSDRLLRLAKHYPDLLTYEEQMIIRIIETHVYWAEEESQKVTFEVKGKVNHALVRACWDEIKALANGEEGSRDRLNKSIQCWLDTPI